MQPVTSVLQLATSLPTSAEASGEEGAFLLHFDAAIPSGTTPSRTETGGDKLSSGEELTTATAALADTALLPLVPQGIWGLAPELNLLGQMPSASLSGPMNEVAKPPGGAGLPMLPEVADWPNAGVLASPIAPSIPTNHADIPAVQPNADKAAALKAMAGVHDLAQNVPANAPRIPGLAESLPDGVTDLVDVGPGPQNAPLSAAPVAVTADANPGASAVIVTPVLSRRHGETASINVLAPEDQRNETAPDQSVEQSVKGLSVPPGLSADPLAATRTGQADPVPVWAQTGDAPFPGAKGPAPGLADFQTLVARDVELEPALIRDATLGAAGGILVWRSSDTASEGHGFVQPMVGRHQAGTMEGSVPADGANPQSTRTRWQEEGKPPAASPSAHPIGPEPAMPALETPAPVFGEDVTWQPASPLPATAVPSGQIPVAAVASQLPVLVAQIVHTATGKAGPVTEIALSPEELGRVRLSFRPHDADPDRIVVMMTFDRPEAMDLFRRHADQLLAEIRAAGFSGADLGFAQSGTQDDGQDRRGRAFSAALPPDSLLPRVSEAPLHLTSGSSLDLRL